MNWEEIYEESSLESGMVSENDDVSKTSTKKVVHFANEITKTNEATNVATKGIKKIPTLTTQQIKNQKYTKNNTNANTFTLIAKARSSVDELIKKRGYNMVEDTTMIKTPVRVEFNLDKFITEFNVREMTIILLNKMKIADPKLRIASTEDNELEWEKLEDIPEDVDFNQHFTVKELSFRRSRKVLVHLNLTSQLHINRIKYNTEVKDFIFKENIWIKTDRYNTMIESSPGFLTMIHPKLVNRESYAYEIMESILQVKEKEQSQKISQEENSLLHKGPKEKIDTDQTIPNFHLETSVKKWGDIKTEVIRINCAKEDSENLKVLLSQASEQGAIQRGTFVPAGLHLMEGKEVVKRILSAHERLLDNTTSIPLWGVNPEELIPSKGTDKTSLREMIKTIEGVKSIEKTYSRGSDKWLLVVDRNKEAEIKKKLTENMDKIYSSQTGQKRIVTFGKQVTSGGKTKQNTVGTYAEILMRKFLPKQLIQDSINTSNQDNTSVTHPEQQNSGLAQKSTQQYDKVQVKTTPAKMAELYNDRNYRNLESKIAALEEAQARTQTENDKKNKDSKSNEINDVKSYVTRKVIEVESNILERVEKKMEEFYQQQTDKQRTLEKELLQNMDQTIQNKIEKISHTVATQVATQLTEVFKNYINPTQYILQTPTKRSNIRISQELSPEGSLAHRHGNQNVQMELHEMYEEKEEIDLNEIQTHENKETALCTYLSDKQIQNHNTRDLLQALNEIDMTNTNKDPKHDKDPRGRNKTCQ